MKLYRLGLLILLIFPWPSAFAQWQWSNPQPTGYKHIGTVALDNQSSLIISSNGDLIRTNNQGASWYVQENLSTAATIAYKDSTIAVGAFSSVYISTDMGHTWQKRLVDYPASFNVQLISRDTILLTTIFPANPSPMFLSSDTGHTWKRTDPGIILRSTWMFNSREGFATSYNYIYKTLDGGKTWIIPDSTAPPGGLSLKFYDKNYGLFFAGDRFWRTVDGGRHWVVSASQVGGSSGVQFIEFLDSTIAISSGENGIIFRSTNKGITWLPVTDDLLRRPVLYACSFSDSLNGTIAGNSGIILKSADGGKSWTSYSPTYLDITSVDFYTDSIGFAATNDKVFKTTNAGLSWLPVNNIFLPGINERFRYIHFFSKDTGVVILESPVRIMKTYNGGANWTDFTPNILYIESIFDFNVVGQTIYLSTNGAYGINILRSLDGGESWTTQYHASSLNVPYFTNLFFTNQETGYGVYGYYVYKTTDGAQTWNQITVIPGGLLQSLWFTDSATGYAAGENSYLIKTSDGGQTWTQLYIDPNNNNIPGDLRSVRFFDKKIGFVISDNNLYRTTNSGNSWTLHATTPASLTDIEINDSTVYAYGINGSIIKRSIRTFEIDSLHFSSVTSCGAAISASISAVYSSVDSVWVQYGTSGFDSTVQALPFTVSDTTVNVSTTLIGLSPNTNYIARVKIFFQGNYYFSDQIGFLTNSTPTPAIQSNGRTLTSSSAVGNQWYLNDVAIPGAVQQEYTPTQSGSYTVIVTIDGCTSNRSLPYSFVVTSVNNPTALENILLFPNPVTNTLIVRNNQLKKLEVRIFTLVGHEIISYMDSKKENVFDLSAFPSGVYLIKIRDLRTFGSMQKMIIKL